MTLVLLAEDDPAIAEPLARALGREGYDVRVQGTGQGAIDGAAAADLVVLDLGLPDMDGLDVARAIRNLGLTTPVLVLTARADEVDLVVGPRRRRRRLRDQALPPRRAARTRPRAAAPHGRGAGRRGRAARAERARRRRRAPRVPGRARAAPDRQGVRAAARARRRRRRRRRARDAHARGLGLGPDRLDQDARHARVLAAPQARRRRERAALRHDRARDGLPVRDRQPDAAPSGPDLCVVASCRRRSRPSRSRSSCSASPSRSSAPSWCARTRCSRCSRARSRSPAPSTSASRATSRSRTACSSPTPVRTTSEIDASVVVRAPTGEIYQAGERDPRAQPVGPGGRRRRRDRAAVRLLVGRVLAQRARDRARRGRRGRRVRRRHRDGDLAGQPADRPARLPGRVGRAARLRAGPTAARAVGRRGDRPRGRRARAQRRPHGRAAGGRAAVRRRRLPPAAHAADRAVDAARGDHARHATPRRSARRAASRSSRSSGSCGSSTTC